jgi:predicted negative regulator of RcsB-dependent stress response
LLAQILIQEGAHDEAAELLDRAEALEPRHGGIFIARGDSLALRGRPQEALAAYERAREVDPNRVASAAQARIDDLRRKTGGSARGR